MINAKADETLLTVSKSQQEQKRFDLLWKNDDQRVSLCVKEE